MNGHTQRQSDHTLFIKHRDGKIAIPIVHADDIPLTSDDASEIESLQKMLATEFEVKDLGTLRTEFQPRNIEIIPRNGSDQIRGLTCNFTKEVCS